GTNSDSADDVAERNLISGNRHDGIAFQPGSGADYNTIAGNYIGTDVFGNQELGNGGYGVEIRGGGVGNLIGVNSPAANPAAGRNIISGNAGIVFNGLGQYEVDQNVVAGNYIGTDVTGGHNLGGGRVYVYNSSSTRIGTDGDGVNDALERNVIP